MRKAVRTICLIAVLVPFLACGKKRVIDPAPPPAPAAPQPSSPEPADPPPQPIAPEPEPEPDPTPAPEPKPIDWLAEGEEAYLGESYDKAIEFYQYYLEEDPQAPQRDQAHYRLGLLAAWQGRYSEALRELQAVRLEGIGQEARIQVTLLIRLLEKSFRDAEEMRTLKQTLNEIMKKLDS